MDDIIREGIDSLIRAGYYENKEKLLDDAFRVMLEARPELKVEVAVELYKEEKISLSRAAEIAGTSLEGFKNILELKGVKRKVEAPSKDKIREADVVLE